MPSTLQPNNFRDAIATVDAAGKRIWINPKQPKGKLYNTRKIVSYLLLVILFGVPLIKVDGEPIFLLNVLERKFIIFGLTFLPQDFHLFVLAMITFIVFIVLFTVVFGRVWCGWACPQTIFMEMVFRRIEYWIEGDHKQQKALKAQPWDQQKLFKRGLKYTIFFFISFLIGNTLLAYVIGSDALFEIVTQSPAKNIAGFSAVVGFSCLFFFIFSWFREQACTVVCPYGRLQGVLLDKDSIVVSYDFNRGEPRGKIKKKQAQQQVGDCVDCTLCVQVCPTGIDIRNGTQLECVNCTACIDACDEVMEKVKRPKGLIRYDSYNGIEKKEKFRFTPRIIAYSVVLVILIAICGFSLTGRVPIESTILRTPGMLYQEEDGKISNLYNLQIANKTKEDVPLTLKLLEPHGSLKLVGKDIIVPAQSNYKGAAFVYIPTNELKSRKTELTIGVFSGEVLLEEVHTNFLGPGR